MLFSIIGVPLENYNNLVFPLVLQAFSGVWALVLGKYNRVILH